MPTPIKLLSDYVEQFGGVRDPYGHFVLTPEELWEFTLNILGESYVLMKHNPDMTAKQLMENFKDE